MDSSAVAPALEVESLCVSYGDQKILRGVSFEVASNRTVAVVGRSGCGKSTLLRAICGLLPSQAGRVTLAGGDVINTGHTLRPGWELRRSIMMVAQAPNLLPYATARRNIALGLELVRGRPQGEAAEEVEEIAEDLGIAEVLDHYPEELSGGQAQRVALARVMVLQPAVLLLDEITSALDPQTTRDAVETLWKLRRLRKGTPPAMVVVTHLLPFATSFADEILFLQDGVVFERGVAATFLERATRAETISFLQIELRPFQGEKPSGNRGPGK